MPLIDENYFVGAMWDPIEGHLDPYGTTHAYAKSARMAGAEIYLHNRVDRARSRTPDGSWDVVTEQGTIHAEHVVNAGGLWAREIGRMVGLELPVLAMEHHYILTEDMPEIAEINRATGKEIVHVIDFDGEIYTRQERQRHAARHLREGRHALVAEDDAVGFRAGPARARSRPHRAVAGDRLPAFPGACSTPASARSSTAPSPSRPTAIRWSGRCAGLKNYWCACAVMAGFSQGGGVGLALVELDGRRRSGLRRLGAWMSRASAPGRRSATPTPRCARIIRAASASASRTRSCPPRGRCRRRRSTTGCSREGAVMGDSWGLETPLWFAPKGVEPKDIVSFHRSNDFEHVKREVMGVREGVGVTEIANFAKYAITGPGAEAFLSHLMANRMPKAGRIVLTPMLNEKGKLIGDFTIAKASPTRTATTASSCGDRARRRSITCAGSSGICRTTARCRSGRSAWTWSGCRSPARRRGKCLRSSTDEDVSGDAFRFLDFRETHLASVPVMVNRVTYTGDLGYEIWVKPEYRAAALRHAHARRARSSASSISACARSSPCGWRRTGRPGSASYGRSTGRTRRMPAASST